MGKSVTRLYSQFQPHHYELNLRLDKGSMTFSGTATIRGKKAGRPSQRITLHGRGLKVSAASIVKHDKKGDQPLELARINLQKSFDEVRLHTSDMVYPGEYTVTLEFSGKITTGMTGIYPCFFEYEGQQHALLMTQFESHYAREAFPCIDEPEAKATFDLTLDTEVNISVLGNTPIKEQHTEPRHETRGTKQRNSETTESRLVTRFETTPRMSTYLLAFVAGELHSKSTKTARGTDVNVWATVAQPANALDFPLEIAKKSIEFFEDYFGVEYPLPKADHVACPDFSAGAMENWGLITYRERALLVYPGETPQSMQEYIATVIAHETSHQWFGNLVTMKWWDDLWLNESFADIMEYQAVDAMHPEWHMWDTFISAEGLSAFRRDSNPGVQAVKTDVHHPDEINTIFDPSIVYAKGGRLLYMLKNYIGEDAFRKGLGEYFSTHAYGNTRGADLWASLSTASGEDVAAFMDPWLEQSGFPVIQVEQQDDQLRLNQEHFCDDPAKADKNRLWPVPLFASEASLPAVLKTKEQNLALPSKDFARINSGARGHYIVNYTQETQRTMLAQQISGGELTTAERLMTLNDISMLARAGYRNYGDVLQLLAAYKAEDSDPVWDMLALIFAEVRRFIDLDETLEPAIKKLVAKVTAAQYQRLGWEERPGESTTDTKLRGTIIGLGAYADVPAIIDKSLALFTSYRKDPASVPAELRGIVFTVPIKQHTAGAFEYLLKLDEQTNNSALKSDIMAALTAVRREDEATILLERLKNSKLVKPQDADHWLIYLLRNRYVKQVAWDWMVKNWDWIEETYKQDKSYDMLPRYSASICNTAEWAKKYADFFLPKTDQIVLKRNIEMGIEEITSRVAWLQRDLSSVQKYFR